MQGWVLFEEGWECGAGAAPVCGDGAEGAGRGGCGLVLPWRRCSTQGEHPCAPVPLALL